MALKTTPGSPFTTPSPFTIHPFFRILRYSAAMAPNQGEPKHLAVDAFYLKSYHYTPSQLVMVWQLVVKNVSRYRLGCVALTTTLDTAKLARFDTTHDIQAQVEASCFYLPTDCQTAGPSPCYITPVAPGFFNLSCAGALLNSAQSALDPSTSATLTITYIIDLLANNASVCDPCTTLNACYSLLTQRLLLQATCPDCHSCLKKELCQTVTLNAGDCLLGYSSIYQSARDAVVAVMATDNGTDFVYSSGFFIGPAGPVVASARNVMIGYTDSITDFNRTTPPLQTFIRVTNVNGMPGVHRVYPCQILGVDGAGGSVFLQPLSNNTTYPLPAICAQPFLTFGDNTATQPGEPVFLMGVLYSGSASDIYAASNDQPVITQGVTDNTHFMLPTNQQGEYLTTSIIPLPAALDNYGGPFLNARGQVIGMFTTIIANHTGQYSAGIGSRAISIAATRFRAGNEPQINPATFMPTPTVAIPSYQYLNKGYLGVNGSVVSFGDLLTDFGSVNPVPPAPTWPPNPFPIQPNLGGFRVTSCNPDSPLLATNTSGAAIYPDFANVSSVRPLYITKIDSLYIGNLPQQWPIGSVLWSKRAGESVTISYLVPPNLTVQTVVVTLGSYLPPGGAGGTFNPIDVPYDIWPII